MYLKSILFCPYWTIFVWIKESANLEGVCIVHNVLWNIETEFMSLNEAYIFMLFLVLHLVCFIFVSYLFFSFISLCSSRWYMLMWVAKSPFVFCPIWQYWHLYFNLSLNSWSSLQVLAPGWFFFLSSCLSWQILWVVTWYLTTPFDLNLRSQ